VGECFEKIKFYEKKLLCCTSIARRSIIVSSILCCILYVYFVEPSLTSSRSIYTNYFQDLKRCPQKVSQNSNINSYKSICSIQGFTLKSYIPLYDFKTLFFLLTAQLFKVGLDTKVPRIYGYCSSLNSPLKWNSLAIYPLFGDCSILYFFPLHLFLLVVYLFSNKCYPSTHCVLDFIYPSLLVRW
jgi:hypothetical protein